jgi:hypothetical protein
LGLTSGAKKILEQSGRLVTQNAPRNTTPVVRARIRNNAKKALDTAELGVPGPKNDTPHPCLNAGSSAHDAGLEGRVQGAIRQTPTRKSLGRSLDDKDLGVSTRISKALLGIWAPDKEPALVHDESADGYFSQLSSGGSKTKGLAHPKLIARVFR